MIYADPKMKDEYPLLPEQLRKKLEDADAWLKAKGWPELFITCIGRTDDDSERIYTPVAERLVRDLELKNLKTDRERVLAGELAKMNPTQRRAWARAKFSWHRCLCAVDIRNRCFSREQRRELMNHLRFGTSPTTHEVLEHDVGRGDHIHLAFKDFAQRKRLLGP